MPAAIRTASLRSRASITMKPPSISLVSMNGPSVADILPSRTCTVMAESGSSSASAITKWPLAFSTSSLPSHSASAALASGLWLKASSGRNR